MREGTHTTCLVRTTANRDIEPGDLSGSCRAALGPAMDEQTISNMRARVAKCRALAKATSDERTRKTLLQMADEGDADIKRLVDQQG